MTKRITIGRKTLSVIGVAFAALLVASVIVFASRDEAEASPA